MDHFPTAWGKPRDESIDPYATFPSSSMRMQPHATESFKDGVQRTQCATKSVEPAPAGV